MSSRQELVTDQKKITGRFFLQISINRNLNIDIKQILFCMTVWVYSVTLPFFEHGTKGKMKEKDNHCDKILSNFPPNLDFQLLLV